MGFSSDLAAEALTATGGDSIQKAAEWILSHRPPHQPNTATSQPKLDRFLRPNSNSKTLTPLGDSNKRPKLSPPSTHRPLSERMRPRTRRRRRPRPPPLSLFPPPLRRRLQPPPFRHLLGSTWHWQNLNRQISHQLLQGSFSLPLPLLVRRY